MGRWARREAYEALANVVIRLGSVAARLLLLAYLAKFVGLSDVGSFGLVAGLAGMAPAAVGWGANFFLSRDLIRFQREGRDLRNILLDRLMLTVLTLVVAATLLSILAATADVASGLRVSILVVGLVAAIVSLECLCLDLQMAFISLGRSVFANVLLLLRSAAWIPFCVVDGYLDVTARSLERLLAWWWAGSLLSFTLGMTALFLLPRTRTERLGASFPYFFQKFRAGPYIYLNDLALVGSLYLERYVVTHFLGLTGAGIYTLCWSIGNAIYAVVQSAILQPSLRRLVTILHEHGPQRWREQLRSEVLRSGSAYAGFVALAVVAIWLSPSSLGLSEIVNHPGLLAGFMVSNGIKLSAEALNYGLYSSGHDKAFAAINLTSMVASLALSAAFTAAWGLLGTACAAILSATVVLLVRRSFLRRAAM